MGQLYTLCQATHGGVSVPQMALDTCAPETRIQMINAPRMFSSKVQKQLLTQMSVGQGWL